MGEAHNTMVGVKQRYWCSALALVYEGLWLYFNSVHLKGKFECIPSVINHTNIRFCPVLVTEVSIDSVPCLIVTFVPCGHAVWATASEGKPSWPIPFE